MANPAVSRAYINMCHRLAHHTGKLTAMAGRAAAGDAGMIHARIGECHGIGMTGLAWQ